MQKPFRLALVVLVLVGLFATTSWADRKTFDELVRDTTRSSPDAFQLANARALVAAWLFTGNSFAQIDALVNDQRRQGVDVVELSQAVEEAKAGQVTNVCIEAQDAPEPLAGVDLAAQSDADLDRLIVTGVNSQLRRAAGREILRRLLNRIALGTEYLADGVFDNVLFDIAKPFNSLYDVRVFGLPNDRSHEEKVFDEFKLDMISYNHGAKAFSSEMIEESGFILAKVYYAEFLVFYAESQLNRNYAALSQQVTCGTSETM